MTYELAVGLRYLKSRRRQTFISLITVISVGGVAVGVMVLIVVLAVMSGFETSLKDKILGINSHIWILAPNPRASRRLPRHCGTCCGLAARHLCRAIYHPRSHAGGRGTCVRDHCAWY